MEKLTCPECGYTVPSNAAVCENCGCKITVCPDCGMVYKVGQIRCSACGHILAEEELHKQAKEDAKKIEERIDADEKREKTIGKFEWAGIIIGLLCMGIAIGIYFLWDNQNDIDALLSMQSRKNLCMAFFIIGLICSTLSDEISDVCKEVMNLNALIEWVQETKFDYGEYIRLHGKVETLDTFDSFLYAVKLSEVALYIESKKTKTVIRIFYIFNFCVAIALNVSFGVFICNLIPQIFAGRFVPIEVEFLTPAFYSCVVFFVFWILRGIFNKFIYPRMINKKREEILHSVKK